MKGAPLEDIADLLGHESLTMTGRYAHLGPNKLHGVVSRCLEQVPPQVPPAKTVRKRLPCKLLYNNHFRGVAQW